jgi:putative peptidoglycan binding protein
MSAEFNFEAIPFEFQELSSQESGFQLEEEFGRRGQLRMRPPRPAPGLRVAKSPRPATAPTLAKPKFRPSPPSHVPPHLRRWPWGVTGAYGVPIEPYPIESEPYPQEPAPARSEHIRWVQSALNDVLGLQLPVNGIADAATRGAIRGFQRQQGLPADGVVGPDTQRALLAARGQQPPPGGPAVPGAPVESHTAVTASELNFEWESLGQELEAAQPSAERAVVRTRIAAGLRDAGTLADLVFFQRHPERGGRKIDVNERDLAAEWRAILRNIILPELASVGEPSGAGAKVGDRDVARARAIAATPAPGLGLTVEQLLRRHAAEAGGIPIEVQLAFIRYEAGRLFDDATAGKWNDKYKKYIPSFYELGVFQTPAGDHGCGNEAGVKTCKYPPPGRKVESSQLGKGWQALAGAYPTAGNWRDPTMQVRVGLWDLVTTADRVRSAFPDLFPSKQSEWWLRMAVLYAFAAGGGAARAFLRKYRRELLALPEAKRWDFLRGKSVGTFSFNPENVDKKMALAAKLRSVRRAQAP